MVVSSRNFRLAIGYQLLVACGAAKTQESSPVAEPRGGESAPAPNKSEKPQVFEAVASAADVVAPWVRPERSSHLAVPVPKGRARERWRLPLESSVDPAFVLAAGTRILVQGRPKGAPTARQSPFVLLDAQGRKIASDLISGDLVRLEPAAGKFYGIGGSEPPSAWQLSDGSHAPDKLGTDDARSVQGALGGRAATHDGIYVYIQPSGVEIDARAAGRHRTVVEPPVEPLDGAIDDEANLHLLVRQDKELALWTTALSGGSIGRVRIGPLRRDRASVPPIVGAAVRVVVLDDRLVAFGRDGRLLWERKGALTGGATLTSDDRLLVASDAKVLAIDPSGRATEVATAPKEVFVTAPIVTGGGLLVVASGAALHAYAFE